MVLSFPAGSALTSTHPAVGRLFPGMASILARNGPGMSGLPAPVLAFAQSDAATCGTGQSKRLSVGAGITDVLLPCALKRT